MRVRSLGCASWATQRGGLAVAVNETGDVIASSTVSRFVQKVRLRTGVPVSAQ